MDYEKQEKLRNIQNDNLYEKEDMPKPEIHPTWFKETPVFCDGKPIGFVGSTKPELNVDVWLVKHPFYTNSQTIIDSEGRVERFMKKYGLKSIEE
jgi:large subunit ribosomal protein L31